ncbi:hypothetical protein ZIOFF_054233 [Zingiber officinale]|uniref:F-box/kelch-repeat protein n=2 Tax=Zingiber officinale TaxID=94328 RepID=A0A8J5FEP9_ZINOF|nr:hypothetical protein ZIOFF_054233 [Zingiber officinale]
MVALGSAIMISPNIAKLVVTIATSSSNRIELSIDPGTWDPMDEDGIVDPIEFDSPVEFDEELDSNSYIHCIDSYQRNSSYYGLHILKDLAIRPRHPNNAQHDSPAAIIQSQFISGHVPSFDCFPGASLSDSRFLLFQLDQFAPQLRKFHFDSTARSVCRLWKLEIDSPYFHCRRKAAGRTQRVIALNQVESTSASPTSTAKPGDSDTGGSPIASYHLALFEPATGSWSRLPSPPSLPRGLPLFCRLATVGNEAVLLGGWDPDSWAATDAVHVYNFASGAWRRGATMPGPRRSFFACGAATGAASVLVAGGHDEEKNALRSAMTFDVGADTWAALPDMSMERDECRGVWLRGRFHVVGGYSTAEQGRFSPTAEALDETTAARWDVAELELEEAGPWMRTCVAGGDAQRLYMCRGDGGGQVAALVEEAARWRSVGEVPADVRVATQLVGWESGLMVMGLEIHGGTLTAYVMEKRETAWRKVAVPDEYSGHVHEACCIEI